MRKVHVYALYDPREDTEVRYVGITQTELQQRLWKHVSYSRTQDTRKDRWIKKIMAEGSYPAIRLLESVPVGEWESAERRWIARLRRAEHPLTNTTDGGEGAPGHRWKWSEEAKKAHSERMKARGLSDAEKERLREARRRSPNMGKAWVGTTRSEEWKKAMSQRMMGNTHYQDWKRANA